MLNQSAPVIYSVTNLLWSDTFTGVTYITRKPDALDADAPDAFYHQPI